MGQVANKDDINKYYEFADRLGKGAYATVKKAIRKRDHHEFAVKVIRKSKLDAGELARVSDEIEINYRVDHPNCVKLYEIFEDEKYIYLVMELLTGGELFDRIVQAGHFSERQAVDVVRDVASALHYMHGIGIVHRDLKPENLIYLQKQADSPIKLTDFGLAKFLRDPTVKLETACGTPAYVAPEVLSQQPYTNAVDLWSLGVILYILLCGFPPFYAENNRELYRQIKAARYSFPPAYWGHVSQSAKDLITQLLVVDPKKRLTAQQVLDHPWVRSDVATNQAFSNDHLEQMKRTQARTKLRRGVQLILAVNKFRRFYARQTMVLDS